MNWDNNMEDILLMRIKQHDINSITDWFGARKDKYYRIGWSYLYSRYDIEDVFHGAIIKVYDNIYQLRKDKYFESWATSIFINECKRVLRERKKSVGIDSIEDVAACDDCSNMELKEQLENIEQIYKEVVVLKYVSGYSQEEIARLLHIPVGTVKSRIYRGLKLLKGNMKKEVSK